jgi:outer membrane protein OmpA-like peptidoglycan-associated protein
MKLLKSAFLCVFFNISAQQQTVETIYFDFDKFDLNSQQTQCLLDFVTKIDTSKVESIQIYGFSDDRGSDNYNYQLSFNRVATVERILLTTGFKKNKIIILKGKGRVIVCPDTVENLVETRSKNRRVDLIVVKKNNYGKGIYNSFTHKIKVGDKIFLESILFDLGSAKLTFTAQKELDKIALILIERKTIAFEIRGHVCCTPEVYQDGVDRETGQRKLSWNRAKMVFDYLAAKKNLKSRMTYKGCGNKYPLGKDDHLDRRVEFLITKI